MSLMPPKISKEDKLKAFIEEPEKKTRTPEPEPPPETHAATEPAPPETVPEEPKKPQKKSQYPWEAAGVTPEIIKPYVLRLPQPDKLKIEYIVKNSLDFRSMHEFCLRAIQKQMEKELKKLGA